VRKDTSAFDKHYVEKHIPPVKKVPGSRHYEVSHVVLCARACILERGDRPETMP
jgi:uncharacterized protein (TIGR02118 family)